MSTNFADVHKFHVKNDLPHPDVPQLLRADVFQFRYRFLREELEEILDSHMSDDLAGVADGLIDLVYVAMGTGVLMGIPWQLLWDEVQRANMSKVRASSSTESFEQTGRGHSYDVVKPDGFVPPQIQKLLAQYTGDKDEE